MEISSKQALQIVVKDLTGNLIAIIDDTGSRTYGGATVSIDRPLTDYTTLEDIEKIGSDVLIPRQVAGFLKCSPYSINCQASKIMNVEIYLDTKTTEQWTAVTQDIFTSTTP